MAFSAEKINQMRNRAESESQDKKEKIQSERSKKHLESEGHLELVESLKKESPLETIKQIIESEGDYVGLAKAAGLEDRLREIADVEGEESEYYQFSIKAEKNFYNSFVKYLRGQRNLDQMYLQSRRVLNIVREMQKKGFEPGETLSTLKKYNKELNLAEDTIDEFTHSNPEIFIASNIKRLRDYKREMERSTGETGRINETPYVKKQLAQVQACIMDGKPIFIHGHLGAGKTEMALRASYKYLKENKTDEEIEENVQEAYGEWLKNNPEKAENPAEKEQVLEEIRKESRTAVVISGSRETSTTDFTGHRTINISTFEEELKRIKSETAVADFEKWEKENPDASDAVKAMKSNALLKVYLEKSGGTFSNFFIGPVYRAMREGRPVIIDEVDAIPHDALIFLNHIMTRKPGDVLPVQGDSGQRVTVAKGFSIILTGNFPKEDQVDTYVGRSQMDAAFLSRLQKLEHDYLPQSLDHSTDFSEMNPDEMQKNELFHVLVSGAIDRYGSLTLPKGEEEKLWKLSCFSRHIQNVFSDRHSKLMQGAASLKDQQELREKLHKEVLSMRQLLDIIREWKNPIAIRGKNEGSMRYELDHYVLEYFIKRTPEEDTKWMLYQVAQQFGLFQSTGWEDALSQQQMAAGAGTVPKFEIESPKNESEDLQKMMPSQVVEMCYGPIPEYDYDIEQKEEPESDIEAAIERERKLDEMKKEMDRLEKIRNGEIEPIASIKTRYTDEEGFYEDIELSLESNIERFSNFYTEHNIETPDDFNEIITEIWNNNAEAIKQAIEEEGFDDMLIIPPYDTEDINKKTTGEYESTWTSVNVDEAGGIANITDTKPNQPRIVLIHRKGAENLERPELEADKNKTIYELCKIPCDAEGKPTNPQDKERIDNLIKNKQPLPIDGLTLGEYLIADRLHFKETGKHLDDWRKDSATWLPASYSGHRVANSLWNSDDSPVNVNASDPDNRHSALGARRSRTFSL